MLNRRYIAVAVFLFIAWAAFFQPRLGRLEYAKDLVHLYGLQRTSSLHFLVPASSSHVQLCRALVSSAVLGYPPAVLSGWNGTGELDAAVTHLAKIRNVVRYFDSLPPTADNDLVLIVDGFDVVMQLPPDVLIRRYFAVTEAANARLAARFGDASAAADDDINRPRQSILFGADKLCWPVDFRRPACYAVPETGLADGSFGAGDDISSNQPRWLNSGTILGPVSSVRDLFAATMDRINATYDPDYICRESDQMYISDVWGEQEYARSLRELQMHATGDADADADAQPLVPDSIDGFIPEGAPPEKWTPVIVPGQKTEYQIGLDYESRLFQAWAGNENFHDFLVFNGTNSTARVDRNIYNWPTPAPYDIPMPTDIASLRPLLDRLDGLGEKDIDTLPLGTNLVTHHVWCLFHCTGEKEYLDELWHQMWFFPYAKALLNATVHAVRSGAKISNKAIDGRIWTGANTYPPLPAEQTDDTELSYGAWADLPADWLSWNEICAEHEDALF